MYIYQQVHANVFITNICQCDFTVSSRKKTAIFSVKVNLNDLTYIIVYSP